jgi:hypothetical protein
VWEHGCAIIQNLIYTAGGFNPSIATAVYRTVLNPNDGSVLSSTEDTALPEARGRDHVVAYSAGGNDYLLQVGGGGYATTDPVYDTCYYAQVVPPSGIENWNLF